MIGLSATGSTMAPSDSAAPLPPAALAAFLGIAWWAYAPSRRERFERDALLPFGNDEDEGVHS